MTGTAGLDAETEDFAQQIADSVSSFLLALRAIAREADARTSRLLAAARDQPGAAHRCPAGGAA